MFLRIPEINNLITTVKISRIDDFIDRCNYYYTVLLLIFFTVLVGTKQYFGEPINCLVDQQFPNSWVNYVHDFCFIMEQYKLTPPNFEDDYLMEFYNGKQYYESYYQWIPFLLFIQAFSFYVPHFLWRSLQKLCNLDIEMTVEEAVKIRTLFGEDRQKAINNLAKYIEQFLCWSSTKTCGFSYFHLKNVFLCSTWLYIGSKLLNSLNIIVQLMVINTYIGDGNFFWGMKLLEQLLHGKDWTETGQFPRVVFCNYELVEMANIAKKNVQCTLTINILSEKIYLLLTLWLMLLFLCTASNALFGIIITLIPDLRERETRFYLLTSLPLEDDEDSLGGVYFTPGDRDGRFSNLSESSTVTASVAAQLRHQSNFNIQHEKIHDVLPDRGCDSDQEELSLKRCEFEQNLNHFLRAVLGIDGIQLIRFMRLHAGALIARDITCVLWEDFINAKRSQNQFCERLKDWQPVLLNAALLKEQSIKADGVPLPSTCANYGDRVGKRPTAPCQTESTGSTSANSVCGAGFTLVSFDEGVNEGSVVSLSTKKIRVRSQVNHEK